MPSNNNDYEGFFALDGLCSDVYAIRAGAADQVFMEEVVVTAPKR